MTPQSVGLTGSQLTIGKLSGRQGLQGKLHELGHDLEGEALDAVYREAIALADAKKEVTDADLLALVEQRAADVPGLDPARRLERHQLARRQGHGHGLDLDRRRDPRRPRRPATARSTPCSRPSTRSSSRSLGWHPGAHRVRDQGGLGRRGCPGPGPRALPALVGRRPRGARRERPRALDEHHRGVARGLPRGGQQAPRRRDQRRRSGLSSGRRRRLEELP